MQWLPQQGWADSGGDMTVAVGSNKGVFIKTKKANFNELFNVLIGPWPGSPQAISGHKTEGQVVTHDRAIKRVPAVDTVKHK